MGNPFFLSYLQHFIDGSFNMKKINLILFVALFFSSCEKVIDISSVTLQNRLVVNALINDQDNISISVSSSTTIQDSVKPAPIKDAVVVVKDKNGVTTNCVFSLLTDKYECGIVPKVGDYFSVTVTAKGFSPAFAEMVIPSKSNNGKSTWKDSTSFDSSGFPNGTLVIKLNDKGNEKNYYRISLFYYQVSLAEWRVLQPILDDAELRNQALKTQDGGIIFKDATFNGKTRNISFTTPFGYSFQSPKFLAVVENLSEQYYNYFKSLDDYKNNRGVFNEPVPVFSNIKNGVGIFAGSSIQRDTIQ